MKCCKQDCETPFCPLCGKQLMDTDQAVIEGLIVLHRGYIATAKTLLQEGGDSPARRRAIAKNENKIRVLLRCRKLLAKTVDNEGQA